ncbi:MAG: RNB domain-containing ribonuclease [Treponema sp.]|jgi:exoribonuclease-2|nr:RNB domain-containing ribonuclease [Treponema sp.]
MIPEKSLVIYRNHPAIVTNIEGEKLNISVFGGNSFKVREKDIEIIHNGPCTTKDLESQAPQGNAREAWELLSDDTAIAGETSKGLSLKEFAELIYGDFNPRAAFEAWKFLSEGLYFTGDIRAVKARPRALVEAEEKKRLEKQRETGERGIFLEKIRKLISIRTAKGGQAEQIALTETERRFLYDVEALARGQTNKSRTLKELGVSETPQEAHRLLLSAGLWTCWENPHPYRFGLQLNSAKIIPDPAPEEERLDLSHLAAYAVDNAWSDDPDDAVSLEGPDQEGRYCLWVHVADPSVSVLPDSPADIEARNRGTTLYLPEGNFRMLAPETLPMFALDSGGNSVFEDGKSGLCGSRRQVPALSFKILLNKDLTIAQTSIFPSKILVTRLSYEEADILVEDRAREPADKAAAGETLARLFDLAARNLERRLNTGAVQIEMPETHIHIIGEGDEKRISVEPVVPRRSSDMVRECMILAGEACAGWAIKNRLPIPFISQEEGELPGSSHEAQGFRFKGLAGCWQLRRCMRPRSISVKPGVHWGLGLDQYTQVTSPLRRYTDLLCHQQIRAFLKQGPVLSKDEIILRIGIAEAAASAAVKAERASRQHWLAVYLSGKKDSSWEGVVLDVKGSRAAVLIPCLGIETQVNLKGNAEPNENIELVLLSVNIPEGEMLFTPR